MSAEGSQLALVVAAVERLGQATCRDVLAELAPTHPELTLTAVSRALYRGVLAWRLTRQRIRDAGPNQPWFVYRPREDLPPVMGERLRDMTEPYLRRFT